MSFDEMPGTLERERADEVLHRLAKKRAS